MDNHTINEFNRMGYLLTATNNDVVCRRQEAGIPIPNGIHGRDAGDDWKWFVIAE